MKVKYQGKETETGADTVAAFLADNGVNVAEAVVELDGEIVAGDAVAAAVMPLGSPIGSNRGIRFSNTAMPTSRRLSRMPRLALCAHRSARRATTGSTS